MSSKETTADIPYIKAQKSNSNLVLKEVQEAMADANVAHEFQDKLSHRFVMQVLLICMTVLVGFFFLLYSTHFDTLCIECIPRYDASQVQ